VAELTTVLRRVYAVDIGSTRCEPGQQPRFAWAGVDPDAPDTTLVGSSDIEELCDHLVTDLSERRSVALGFEAPLFIPVPVAAANLCRGRTNEGSRSFAAPAGLAVTALGLHQAAWILRRIQQSCGAFVGFTVAPTAWPPNSETTILFCWEAFVSQGAHSATHIGDAATAVMEFLAHEADLQAANAVTAEEPFSLIAAAAMWSRLNVDVEAIRQPVVVLRPTKPFAGEVASPPKFRRR
jgi:hypothetical protein